MSTLDDNDPDSEHTPTPSQLPGQHGNNNNNNVNHPLPNTYMKDNSKSSNESSGSNGRQSRTSKSKSRSSKAMKASRRNNNNNNSFVDGSGSSTNQRSSRASKQHPTQSSSYPHTSRHRDSHNNNVHSHSHRQSHSHTNNNDYNQYGSGSGNNSKSSSRRQKPTQSQKRASKRTSYKKAPPTHSHNHNDHSHHPQHQHQHQSFHGHTHHHHDGHNHPGHHHHHHSKRESEKDKQGQHQNKRKYLMEIEEKGNTVGNSANKQELPNRKKLVILAVGDTPLPSHAAFDFIHCKVGMERKVMWKHFDVMVLIVPTNTPSKKKETMFEACRKAKKVNPKLFICIIDIEASESAVFRSKCFSYGANMVTNDHHSLKQVLNIIGQKGFGGQGTYECPYCHMQNLTEDELWHHVPLYHVNDQQQGNIICPICNEDKRRNYLLHLRNHHGPVIRGEIAPEYRDGILTHAFALVVVRRPTDNKFLVVQEAANSGFWLPGGRVEVGETLLEAAMRETKEEAGIEVDIKGVLKVEHSTYAFDDRKKAYNRMRVIFYAEPMDEKELPKSVPNYDSAGATFISISELDEITLRADEPREWFHALTQNFYYHSLDILSCWKHDHRTTLNAPYVLKEQKYSNRSEEPKSLSAEPSNIPQKPSNNTAKKPRRLSKDVHMTSGQNPPPNPKRSMDTPESDPSDPDSTTDSSFPSDSYNQPTSRGGRKYSDEHDGEPPYSLQHGDTSDSEDEDDHDHYMEQKEFIHNQSKMRPKRKTEPAPTGQGSKIQIKSPKIQNRKRGGTTPTPEPYPFDKNKSAPIWGDPHSPPKSSSSSRKIKNNNPPNKSTKKRQNPKKLSRSTTSPPKQSIPKNQTLENPTKNKSMKKHNQPKQNTSEANKNSHTLPPKQVHVIPKIMQTQSNPNPHSIAPNPSSTKKIPHSQTSKKSKKQTPELGDQNSKSNSKNKSGNPTPQNPSQAQQSQTPSGGTPHQPGQQVGTNPGGPSPQFIFVGPNPGIPPYGYPYPHQQVYPPQQFPGIIHPPGPGAHSRGSFQGTYITSPHIPPDQGQQIWAPAQPFPGQGQVPPPQFPQHQMPPQYQQQFYQVQVSPQQQTRGGPMAQPTQNIIYHTTLNPQSQHVNGSIYQTQQPLIYAPTQIMQQPQPQPQQQGSKVTDTGDGKSVKQSKTFQNLHSHQPQPKPELKPGPKSNGVKVPTNGLKSPQNSNKRPKSTTYGSKKSMHHSEFAAHAALIDGKRSAKRKKGKGNQTQSDSLLRKKQHRRSLSSGILPKTSLQTNVSQPQHNTTPPPGNIYSDELNRQATNRGLGSHNEHSNTSR